MSADVGREAVEAVSREVAACVAPLFQEAAEMEVLRRKESLSEIEVERVYGYNRNTLRIWRSKGLGPAFHRYGRIILYLQKDLRSFQESHRVRTADARH